VTPLGEFASQERLTQQIKEVATTSASWLLLSKTLKATTKYP
jgi:hypothetical protein